LHLPAEKAYHPDRTCHWCFCWVCSWEVYSRVDCQSVTLEHTRSHRVLCQSPLDDCHVVSVDPTQWMQPQQNTGMKR